MSSSMPVSPGSVPGSQGVCQGPRRDTPCFQGLCQVSGGHAGHWGRWQVPGTGWRGEIRRLQGGTKPLSGAGSPVGATGAPRRWGSTGGPCRGVRVCAVQVSAPCSLWHGPDSAAAATGRAWPRAGGWGRLGCRGVPAHVQVCACVYVCKHTCTHVHGLGCEQGPCCAPVRAGDQCQLLADGDKGQSRDLGGLCPGGHMHPRAPRPPALGARWVQGVPPCGCQVGCDVLAFVTLQVQRGRPWPVTWHRGARAQPNAWGHSSQGCWSAAASAASSSAGPPSSLSSRSWATSRSCASPAPTPAPTSPSCRVRSLSPALWWPWPHCHPALCPLRACFHVVLVA